MSRFILLAFFLSFVDVCYTQNNEIDTFYCHVRPIVYIKNDTTVNSLLISHPKGEFIFFLKEDSAERYIKNVESFKLFKLDDRQTNNKKQNWLAYATKFIRDTVADTLKTGDISNYLDAHSLDYQHEIRLKYILDRMGMSPAKDDICLIYIQDDFSPRSDRVQKSGVNGYIFNKKDEGGYELEVYHGVSNNVDGLKPTGNEKYSCTEKQAQRLIQMLEYTTFPDSSNILTQRVENMTIVVAQRKAYFVPDRDDDYNKNAFIYNIECLKWEFELLAKRLQKMTK